MSYLRSGSAEKGVCWSGYELSDLPDLLATGSIEEKHPRIKECV
jgi:hypothetical protein